MTLRLCNGVLSIALILAAFCSAAAAQAPEKVKVALARSISNGAIMLGQARGYFKAEGIDVELQEIDTAADALAIVAQGQIQVVGAGISAGYFNAVDRGLPVIIVASRVNTPVGHNLMIRPDLASSITSMKDLKGRVIASNGPGSVSTYEIGKMIEPSGLKLDDVNVKIFPFTQYALAFANKAIDAGLVIPPWTAKFADEKIALPFGDADKLVEPRPVTIAVDYANADWLKRSPDTARRFFVGYMKSVRDWCQGYHGAPVRKEIIDLLIKSKVETRIEVLDSFWTARPVNGRVDLPSLLDVQSFYVANKMAGKAFPSERLVDHSFVDAATARLGAFELEKKDSRLAGCR